MKELLFIYEAGSFPRHTIEELGAALYERGYAVTCMAGMDLTPTQSLFDLSNLPPAEMEELRALVASKANEQVPGNV
jgi:hypothetical protein